MIGFDDVRNLVVLELGYFISDLDISNKRRSIYFWGDVTVTLDIVNQKQEGPCCSENLNYFDLELDYI